MRKIAATYIYLQNSQFLKNSFLVVEEDGTILKIIDTQGNLQEQAGMEHYSGMLVPAAFLNNFIELKDKQIQNPDKIFSKLMNINGFEVGAKPGVCLISGMDLANLKLFPSSMIKELV